MRMNVGAHPAPSTVWNWEHKSARARIQTKGEWNRQVERKSMKILKLRTLYKREFFFSSLEPWKQQQTKTDYLYSCDYNNKMHLVIARRAFQQFVTEYESHKHCTLKTHSNAWCNWHSTGKIKFSNEWIFSFFFY